MTTKKRGRQYDERRPPPGVEGGNAERVARLSATPREECVVDYCLRYRSRSTHQKASRECGRFVVGSRRSPCSNYSCFRSAQVQPIAEERSLEMFNTGSQYEYHGGFKWMDCWVNAHAKGAGKREDPSYPRVSNTGPDTRRNLRFPVATAPPGIAVADEIIFCLVACVWEESLGSSEMELGETRRSTNPPSAPLLKNRGLGVARTQFEVRACRKNPTRSREMAGGPAFRVDCTYVIRVTRKTLKDPHAPHSSLQLRREFESQNYAG